MSDFYDYFKENMESLGLPAPASLFGSIQSAVGTAAVILASIDKYGTRVTLRELIGAGTRLEVLGVVGACAATFYVGAVIGSLAVAGGRTLSGGVSLADVLFEASRLGFKRPWLTSLMHRMPIIYTPGMSGRQYYKHHGLIR